MVIILLFKRHWGSQGKDLWLPINELVSNKPTTKDQMRAPGLVCASLYNLPFIYISRMTVMSLTDVTIVCFFLQMGKTFVHVQWSHTDSPGHLLASPTYFLPCTKHYMNSVSQFLGLWHIYCTELNQLLFNSTCFWSAQYTLLIGCLFTYIH